MNGKMFGALVVSAVVGMVGGAALADHHEGGKAADQGCYRKSCGGSVAGHKGSCGGTKVDGLASEKTCTDAGGAWTTAAAAEEFKKKPH